MTMLFNAYGITMWHIIDWLEKEYGYYNHYYTIQPVSELFQ